MPAAPVASAVPPKQAQAPRPGWRLLRLIPLVIAAAAMAIGLDAGLARLGLTIGPINNATADLHGALMISGFLGTVISLERAVALGRGWGYLAPALSAFGALMLLTEPRLAAAAFTAAAGVLFTASTYLALRQLALFSIVLAVAAACWAAGTALWLAGSTLPNIVGWWLNFLILTIAAERLELSRVLRVPAASQVVFAVAATLLLVGSARSELTGSWAPFTAAGLLACSAWLLSHDIARRTVRFPGPPRFSALAILAGHVWLGIGGLVLLAAPYLDTALIYDAVVHALAIGVIMSMIFGHAPIILPAVTGFRLSVTARAYLPLALLHGAVLIRVGGDLGGAPDLRLVSAVVMIVALASYAGILVVDSRRHRSGQAA